jgi:hypothetical protein
VRPVPAFPDDLHRAVPEAVRAALAAAVPPPSVRLVAYVALPRAARFFTRTADGPPIEVAWADIAGDAVVMLGGTPPDSPHAYRGLLVAAGMAAEVLVTALGPLTGSITLSEVPGAWPVPAAPITRLTTVTMEAP